MDKSIPIAHWSSEDFLYNVYLTNKCFEKIKKIALEYYPNEVGSSLIGNYSDDGFSANIITVGPIPPDSSASRTSFNRGIKGLKDFFDSLRLKFGYSKHYVGEWHSHPNGDPFPSEIDDKNQFSISADPTANCPESILLIIGHKFGGLDNLKLFIYSNKKGRVPLVFRPEK